LIGQAERDVGGVEMEVADEDHDGDGEEEEDEMIINELNNKQNTSKRENKPEHAKLRLIKKACLGFSIALL
jgi:hypothetical protein